MKVLIPRLVISTERMDASESVQLINECLAGNESAIEAFVRLHETNVFRFALSIVGDQAEANEITQETFLSALRSLRTYQEKNSLKAWLFTIALNHSRNHLRKQKFLERLKAATTLLFQTDLSRKPASPEEAVIRDEKEAAIWQELNKLDERHRIVVILRYFHELSIAEISDILAINEGTIHSRLHTARERLKSRLEHLDGE